MRNILLISLSFVSIAQATPKLAWSLSGASIQQPESAFWDAETQAIYVSNVAGAPDAKDGNGWINKLSPEGKPVQPKWVDHLNAPKGIRTKHGKLYVSDIDRLIEIETKTGKIMSTLSIPGAKFLNDVEVADDGTVYVSDTMANKIFTVEAGKAKAWLDMESPNGILIVGDELVLANWGKGMAPDWSTKTPGQILGVNLKTKKTRTITPNPLGNLDGIEITPRGEFLVSDWAAGKVFVVKNGVGTTILSGFKGSADIGYIPEKNLIIVPRMGDNKLDAYALIEM